MKQDDTRLLLLGQGVLFDALEQELRCHTATLDVGRGLPDGGGGVAVTAHDFPDPARDQTVQHGLRRRGIPWLPIWADHLEVWAGPWIFPAGTSCLTCAGARNLVPELLGKDDRHPGASRLLPAWLGRLLAAIVLRELALGRDEAGVLLRGRVLIWSLATLHAQLHAVSRVPGCPACPPRADDTSDHARRTFERLI